MHLRLGNELSSGAKRNASGEVVFLSLLSSIRGSHVLEDSSADSARQAALQGAVAKPHVLQHKSAET